LLGTFFLLVLIGLWSRAYYIQIVQGSKLEKEAEDQYWDKKTAYGKRGEIYDRKGNLLAKTVMVDSVFARPKRIKNPVRASRILGEILELETGTIRAKLQKKADFVWIVRQIGDVKSKKIRDARLKGIYLIEKQRRYYPQGHLAGQLLGCVGVDNKGLEGLELSFDKYLRGSKKKYLQCKDAAGRLIAPGQVKRDLSGKDLKLTLDSTIQYAAEKALERAVTEYEGKSGSCLVLKVDSGDVLAWANYPFFNPNKYRHSSAGCRRNRVALDVLEPGSTLKPILVASALQEDVCSKNDQYFCENGKWTICGEQIRDTHEYGKLPVHKIIRYSSNIGAGKIGLELGKKRLYSYLSELGVGKKSTLPLPGEGAGILRPAVSWTEVDLVSASFGQGLSMNSLQLAKMYNCLANNGVLKDLNLLKKPAEDTEKDVNKRVFSPETANTVLKMLRSVVEQNGTGTKARIKGLHVGGKTGTAQKAGSNGYTNKYTASFVGLFPALNPEYLVLAIVNEPRGSHYGGVVAAPVVREVGQELLAYKDDLRRTYVDKSEEVEVQESVQDKKNYFQIAPERNQKAKCVDGLDMDKVPNIKGEALRCALEKLAKRGVLPEIRGKGQIVKKQSPSPGSPIKESVDNTIWLTRYE